MADKPCRCAAWPHEQQQRHHQPAFDDQPVRRHDGHRRRPYGRHHDHGGLGIVGHNLHDLRRHHGHRTPDLHADAQPDRHQHQRQQRHQRSALDEQLVCRHAGHGHGHPRRRHHHCHFEHNDGCDLRQRLGRRFGDILIRHARPRPASQARPRPPA